MALRLGDETGERQQFAPLLLAQARQMRPVGFNGAQHTHTGVQFGIGKCGNGAHGGIVSPPNRRLRPLKGRRHCAAGISGHAMA
jgi:hypothetical protein